MASFDNLMTVEQPWAFRPTFTDSWISDIYTKETDILTNALQRSFAGFSSAEMVDSILVGTDVAPIQTPTASGCSENEAPSVPVPKPRRGLPPAGGRVAKRKSRASKRSTTTFITADAANFRQMVQQVTGVRFPGTSGGLPTTTAQLLGPEPRGIVDRLQMGGVLPTLDTSAFLLDGSASNLAAQLRPAAVTDGSGLGFDPFCGFPTLESWKVV